MIHQDVRIILIPMLSLDVMFMVIMIIDIHMLNAMSPSIAVTEEISMGINIMNNNMVGVIFAMMYLVALVQKCSQTGRSVTWPFHCHVHRTQNPIKIEPDENKTVLNPNSNLKTPPKPTCITTIKKEVEVVGILSSDEENVKEDNPKHADSKTPEGKTPHGKTPDSKPADSNGVSKKMFPLFVKGYKPPKPVDKTESDDGDILIPVLVRKHQLELYCDYESNICSEGMKDSNRCAVFSIREESAVKDSDPNVAKKGTMLCTCYVLVCM